MNKDTFVNTLRHTTEQVYEIAGIPDKQYKNLPHTTEEKLLHALHTSEEYLRNTPSRMFPASFDPNEKSLTAFPRSLTWSWDTGERILRSVFAQSVMSFVPLFWQTEIPLYAACRAAGATLLVSDPENVPMCCAAVRSIAVDTIIGEVSIVDRFITELAKREQTCPKLLYIIHRKDASNWNVPENIVQNAHAIAQEVHLFPGVPILQQCPILATEKSTLFHPSSSYYWEFESDATYISSLGDDILPVFRLLLPVVLDTKGSCSCGSTLVSHI